MNKAEKLVEKAYNTGYSDGYSDSSERWIPVSVLLPSKEDTYLVTVEYDGRDGKKKTVGISDWCGGSFIVYNIFTKARVTAWMPRPKPYEEEKDGN